MVRAYAYAHGARWGAPARAFALAAFAAAACALAAFAVVELALAAFALARAPAVFSFFVDKPFA